MALFKTLNTTIDKTNYTIKISNIDYAHDHWGGEKTIINSLSKIDNILYGEDFDADIVSWAIELSEQNKRIVDGAFYRIPDQNKLIFCVITKVPEFKEGLEIGVREMNINYKKRSFAFSVVEIIVNERDKEIPKKWALDEKLTGSYRKYVAFI